MQEPDGTAAVEVALSQLLGECDELLKECAEGKAKLCSQVAAISAPGASSDLDAFAADSDGDLLQTVAFNVDQKNADNVEDQGGSDAIGP